MPDDQRACPDAADDDRDPGSARHQHDEQRIRALEIARPRLAALRRQQVETLRSGSRCTRCAAITSVSVSDAEARSPRSIRSSLASAGVILDDAVVHQRDPRRRETCGCAFAARWVRRGLPSGCGRCPSNPGRALHRLHQFRRASATLPCVRTRCICRSAIVDRQAPCRRSRTPDTRGAAAPRAGWERRYAQRLRRRCRYMVSRTYSTFNGAEGFCVQDRPQPLQ